MYNLNNLDDNDKIMYDIRDELHSELSPCTNEEFLSAYCKKHADKYGEEFEIDGVPAIEAVRA